MHTVPSSFWVLGSHIHVEIVPPDRWTYGDDDVGVYNPDTRVIVIKDRGANQNIQTFWHESLHAALDALNSKHYEDEVLVDTLAGAIVQIMETAHYRATSK